MRKIAYLALAAAAAGAVAPANATLVVFAPGGVTEAVYDTASNLTGTRRLREAITDILTP